MPKTRYGKTAWWWLLHTRNELKEHPRCRSFPPIQPYCKAHMRAVKGLIECGIFEEVKTDDEGRLFYKTTLSRVTEAIANGTVRD